MVHQAPAEEHRSYAVANRGLNDTKDGIVKVQAFLVESQASLASAHSLPRVWQGEKKQPKRRLKETLQAREQERKQKLSRR